MIIKITTILAMFGRSSSFSFILSGILVILSDKVEMPATKKESRLSIDKAIGFIASETMAIAPFIASSIHSLMSPSNPSVSDRL